MRADPPPECSAPLLRIGKTMKMALIENNDDKDSDADADHDDDNSDADYDVVDTKTQKLFKKLLFVGGFCASWP